MEKRTIIPEEKGKIQLQGTYPSGVLHAFLNDGVQEGMGFK
jgi:hypothetical protein